VKIFAPSSCLSSIAAISSSISSRIYSCDCPSTTIFNPRCKNGSSTSSATSSNARSPSFLASIAHAVKVGINSLIGTVFTSEKITLNKLGIFFTSSIGNAISIQAAVPPKIITSAAGLYNAIGSDPFKINPPISTIKPSIMPIHDVLSTPNPHFSS
jgi:hypothetical protein